MIKKFFKSSQKEKYVTLSLENKFNNSIDDEFWIYCDKCNNHIFKKDMEENLNICTNCNKHYKINSRKRIDLICDKGSFKEFNKVIDSKDPLNFPGYKEKLKTYKEKSGEDEAVITGVGKINGIKTILCIMNPDFMMGSMGSIVGDKITYAFDYAALHNTPIVIFTSSGGARMQEGMISLIQMVKTCQVIKKLEDKSIPYISVLTDPTTGGVTASFAMIADIVIAEPNALIGFAGPRVIEQTIKQKLPTGFQSSEFLLKNGFIDIIVERSNLKNTLYDLLSMHNFKISKG